jgi:hypothetical protein
MFADHPAESRMVGYADGEATHRARLPQPFGPREER